jgi:hypothetical protein
MCRGKVIRKIGAIAPDNLRQFVSPDQSRIFTPMESVIPDRPRLKWRFPAGSVTAVELPCA